MDMRTAEYPSESSVLGIAVLLARRRRAFAVTVLAAMLLTAILVLLVPVTYTGTAVILAPQPSGMSASALLGQLGTLTSLAGDGFESSLKSPQDMYLGLLASRTVADDMIERFNLRTIYRRKRLVDLRRALARHTRIESTKGWLIRISVVDHSAQRSADMANAYVEELYRVNRGLALTQAAQRRLFLEQQVTAESEVLSGAELDFKRIQEKTGVVQLSGQAELTLRTIAQLRAEIVSRELQLHQLRSIATENNDNVAELEAGLAALRGQLSEAVKSSGAADGKDYFLPASKIPSAGLDYLRKARNLKFHEALFETLSRQYEMARIDEAKSPPVIQVVDRAVPLDKRTWPPRTLLVLLAGLLSAFGFAGYVLCRDAWERLAAEPANAAHLASLKQVAGR